MRQDQKNKEILKILSARDPVLAQQVGDVDIRGLAHEVRLKVAGVISDELAEKGFQSNWEPNNYGLLLEDLIDFCDLVRD